MRGEWSAFRPCRYLIVLDGFVKSGQVARRAFLCPYFFDNNKSEVCMKMKLIDRFGKRLLLSTALTAVSLMMTVCVYAQDGKAGIQEANTKVRGYFDVGCDLMYAVGAILGLIGAVRVYQKWSNGHPDTGSTAAAWFGSCVFLVIVATVLRSFFGI